jgi:diacylglycerol kinase family enzyme
MQVEYDGNVLYDEFIYGMVTNTVSVGGMKGLISGEVDLGDGLFEVTLVRMPKNPIELSQIVSSLTGVDTETDMVTSFQTSRVKFTAAEEIPWTLDGEYGGKPTEVEIRALHGAVRIVS